MPLRSYSQKGWYYDSAGYILVPAPDHPNARKSGYVLAHVKVMSEQLGRPLLPFEEVHHRNGVRDDNRAENLERWSTSQPPGQRVEDKILWAVKTLQLYAPRVLNASADDVKNLALPHAAAVAREARIAQAHADREATQAEQEADALKAAARRDSQIKQAGYQAEIDQAAAQSRQAGPLSEATARQQVVVEETKVAELEAQREEQRLQASVRKPADARAYEKTTLARADRDARISGAEAERREVELNAANAQRVRLEAAAGAERVKLEATARSESTRQIGEAEAAAVAARGRAEGEAVRARGMAEAEAIKARADALSENQDAVIGQQLAEQWPAIVEAAAKPFGGIDQLIVLNGAQGLSEALAQALSQGVAGLQLARNLLAGPSGAGGATGAPNGGKPAADTTTALERSVPIAPSTSTGKDNKED